MRTKTVSAIIGFGFLIVACATATSPPPLPTPEVACPVALDWHGLVAGQSTRQEVVQALGNPLRQGSQQVDNRRISFYAYAVEGGSVARFVEDRVFFRANGTVDWMEVVVADRDGRFHAVQEITKQVGDTLDTVYSNNNYNPASHSQYDVLGGPDQLYIWSECGLVLDVLPYCSPTEVGGPKCVSASNSSSSRLPISETLKLRQPSPYNIGGDAPPDVDNIILMKILIPPTSYAGFQQTYMYKIPFGLWDAYVHKVIWGKP